MRPTPITLPVGVLVHGLDPSGTEEPLEDRLLCDAAALDLGRRDDACLVSGAGMDHDGGALRVGIGPELGRAQRHEGVGATRRPGPGGSLVGHERDRRGHAVDRLRDRRALGRRQLRVHLEAPAFVAVGPRHRAHLVVMRGLLDLDAAQDVAFVADAGRRDASRPLDQPVLGLIRREPCQFDHLVDTERARLERARRPAADRTSACAASMKRRAFQSEMP